jgi:hypothetical protein
MQEPVFLYFLSEQATTFFEGYEHSTVTGFKVTDIQHSSYYSILSDVTVQETCLFLSCTDGA